MESYPNAPYDKMHHRYWKSLHTLLFLFVSIIGCCQAVNESREHTPEVGSQAGNWSWNSKPTTRVGDTFRLASDRSDDCNSSQLALNIKHTAHAFINGFEAWDAKDILSYRTDDCVQYILPVSYSHGEARDNEGYRTWFEGVKPVFHNFTVGCGCSSPIEWVEC